MGVRADDVEAIRKQAELERQARILTWLMAALVAVASFTLGYIVGTGTESGQSNYPYAASPSSAFALALRKRRPGFASFAIAAIGVLMFMTGYFVPSPGIGVVTLYGTYSR